MLEKITVLLIIYTAILVCDVPKLKKTNSRERGTYGVIMLAAVYLSIDYVTEANWPNLHEVINFFFLEPAKRIVESVKLPVS